MTGRRATLSLPRLRRGRWPVGPDGVWKAALRRWGVGAAGHAKARGRGFAGRRDGPVAAIPPILAEVRSGAASEHDKSGNDALARFAQPSHRRAQLSQADADWTLFRGLRLPRAQNHCRSGRPDARDVGSEDQGRRKRRMVSTGGISCSSLSRRSYHWRPSDRHRAHQGGAPGLNRQARQPPWKARDRVCMTGRSFEQRAIPHPSLRATFPSAAGEGDFPRRR